ncbi:MAG TPA: glycosyltransferase 87 family protein [Terracidiphilus sp.]
MPAHVEKGTKSAAARRDGAIFLALGSALFAFLAIATARTPDATASDFQAVYLAARSAIHGTDPYNPAVLERAYDGTGPTAASDSYLSRRVVTVNVNLPSCLLALAPLASLPWEAARPLWILLLALTTLIAAWLMWLEAAPYAPIGSAILLSLLLCTDLVTLDMGNTAGLVIALACIASWLFIRERLVYLGCFILAIGLVIKPHDAGIVWLYFVLAGAKFRTHALRTAAIAIVIAIVSVGWMSHVAPDWMPELQRNLAATQGPGDVNDPGSAAPSATSGDAVIDLQSVTSLINDAPWFYNGSSYILAGALLLTWCILVLRSDPVARSAWIALASASALAMLPVYHRQHDVRLVLIAIPACFCLLQLGRRVGRIAIALTALAVFVNGDTPTLARNMLARVWAPAMHCFTGKLLTVVLIRPVAPLLLLMGCFYLWALYRESTGREAGAVPTQSAGMVESA